MTIQSVGSTDAGHFVTFRQLNDKAVTIGKIAVAERMNKAHPEMLGMSGFKEATERAFAVVTDKIEQIMQRDDDYVESATQDTKPTTWESNYVSVASQNQIAAASAYSYFK
ncbi:MAG: hypothetical protein IKE46_03960 [Selenomonadaceae bacterium]|nr:hypothetical protein [Selenomonadaceae bacterium]